MVDLGPRWPPWEWDKAAIRRRFFRDMTPDQRRSLFMEFGMTEVAVAQMRTRDAEERMLDFFLSLCRTDAILRRLEVVAIPTKDTPDA